MEKKISGVPEPTLRRLPLYYHYLKTMLNRGREHISCTHIGKALLLESVQIRKDLAFTGIRGQPRVGYSILELINSIEEFFGWNRTDEAFIVGVGHLGRALLGYKGFERYGFKIVAAFDKNPKLIGTEINGVKVLPVDKLEDLCRRMQVKIGVITVPENYAQDIADSMVKGGIKAIWNFAPTSLKVNEDIIVENEIIASGLAVLCKRLQQKMQKNQEVVK
jgi:redox-sensing transcriptional repressor